MGYLRSEGPKPQANARTPNPKAESRKPKAESPKPKAQNRKPRAESRLLVPQPRRRGLAACEPREARARVCRGGRRVALAELPQEIHLRVQAREREPCL